MGGSMAGSMGGGMSSLSAPTIDPIGDAYYGSSVEETAESHGGQSVTRHNSLAVLRFQTSDTSIRLRSLRHGLSLAKWRTLGVYVNGVWSQGVEITSDDTLMNLSVSLPAGADKVVEIYECLQSKPTGGAVQGGYVRGVTGNVTMLAALSDTATRKLALYGDSISVGDGSTIPTRDGAVPLLRQDHPGGRGAVSVEGWGYRAIADESDLDDLAQRLVDLVAGAGAREVWTAIGTNDYGINRGSAADYGTDLAYMLDALNTLDDQIVVFVQTPLARTTETANSFGDTLGDYRTQATTVANARAFCILVDGEHIIDPSADSGDGVHPNDAGHALWKSRIEELTYSALPAATTSDLIARWRADMEHLTLSGSDVTDWADMIGGHDLTEATNPPSLALNAINGRHGVTFASGETMTAADDADFEFGTGTWWRMDVIKRPLYGGGFSVLWGKSNHGDGDHVRLVVTALGTFGLNWGTDSESYTPPSTLVIPDDVACVVGFGIDANAGEVIYMVDGVIERRSITVQGTGSNSLPWRVHGDGNNAAFDNDVVTFGEMLFATDGSAALPTANLLTPYAQTLLPHWWAGDVPPSLDGSRIGWWGGQAYQRDADPDVVRVYNLDSPGTGDLVQGTASLCPHATTMNGRNAIAFSATQWLQGSDWDSLDFADDSWLVLMAVNRPNNSYHTLWGKGTSASDDNHRGVVLNTERLVTYFGNDSTGNYSIGTDSMATSTPTIIAWGRDEDAGDTVYVVDSVIERISEANDGTGANSTGFRLNGDPGGGLMGAFDLGEMIVFRRAAGGFSDAEITRAIAWLEGRWI